VLLGGVCAAADHSQCPLTSFEIRRHVQVLQLGTHTGPLRLCICCAAVLFREVLHSMLQKGARQLHQRFKRSTLQGPLMSSRLQVRTTHPQSS
jgi:hypothetical protein